MQIFRHKVKVNDGLHGNGGIAPAILNLETVHEVREQFHGQAAFLPWGNCVGWGNAPCGFAVVKELIWPGIEPRFLGRTALCLMMQYSGCPNIEVLLCRVVC